MPKRAGQLPCLGFVAPQSCRWQMMSSERQLEHTGVGLANRSTARLLSVWSCPPETKLNGLIGVLRRIFRPPSLSIKGSVQRRCTPSIRFGAVHMKMLTVGAQRSPLDGRTSVSPCPEVGCPRWPITISALAVRTPTHLSLRTDRMGSAKLSKDVLY